MKKIFLTILSATLAYSDYSVKTELKPNSLKGISQNQIDQHWSLYEGYVKQVNDILSKIKDAKDRSDLKRRYGFEFNGMILHELYFENLSNKKSEPSDKFKKMVAKDFGSYENWKDDFIATGKMRGIGWAILYFDPTNSTFINQFVEDHKIGNITNLIPIVVMDVWEHAYMVDHPVSGRPDYITAFMANLNWDVINKRLIKATK